MNKIITTINAVGITLVCVLVLAGQGSSSHAQGSPRGPKYATVTSSVKPPAIAPGGHGELDVHISVEPTFHINVAHPKDPDLIATAFIVSSSRQVIFGAPIYPKDQSVTTMTGKLMAYTGNIDIRVPFTLKKSASSGTATVAGSLTYQGCNANACYPPKTEKVSASVKVK
jgi:hypothetical protein